MGGDSKWHGNFIKTIVLRVKLTNVYENVQALYDGEKLVGLFATDSKAYQWWSKTYIPSKRSATLIPEDKWDLGNLT